MEAEKYEQWDYALAFIQTFITSWRSVTKEISVIQMPSASNYVLRIENTKGCSPQYVIYRVFSDSDAVDNEQERRVFTRLADLDIGPKSYGSDEYCRVEEYLEGFIQLSMDQLKQQYIIEHIARMIKQIQSIDMSDACSPKQNIFVENLRKWRNIAKTQFQEPLELPENRQSLIPTILELISEETMSAVNSLLPSEYEPVFCHGDFHRGNILYSADSNKGLIDFEYSGYSYDAFDLANIINEANGDETVPEFPYFRYYTEYEVDNAGIARWVKACGKDVDFWVDVKIFICLLKIYWAMWAAALVQSWSIGNTFDHMTNAATRFLMVKEDLPELLDLGREGLRKIGEQFFN